jgi:oxygen-dependent protoporphyrinogen oxidase
LTDLDVAVVGAGVAGLTAASELRKAGLDVRVFEAEHHVGGRMASFRHQGYTIDTGAEQIPTHGYRATWELLARLGVPLSEVPLIGKSIGMWRDGKARPGVSDPRGLLTGAGVAGRARADQIRFLASLFRRKREFDSDHPEDTPLGTATIAELTRRYHPDLHDYLYQPVANSFFGWDTTRSAAAPMVSLMLDIGTVSSWRTYRDGMDTLARRLATRVDVVTGSAVQCVIAERDAARLIVGPDTVRARTVLLCVPAPVAARLYADPPPEERAFLSACTFTPTLKVSCLLDRPLAPRSSTPLYALLFPAVQDRVLAGLIVDHAKHPSRVPPGRGLLSLLTSPARIPELLDEPDRLVIDRLTTAARRYLPALPEATRNQFVHRFHHGLPEATPEALRQRAAFMKRPVRPVDYAGDWVMLRPSSEGAVRAGALAASRTLSRLRPPDRAVSPRSTEKGAA